MKRAIRGLALFGLSLSIAACGPRLSLVTGTTVGLKASPGDGSTTPPQVTLAYKRAEGALVPTKGTSAADGKNDAYSALAVFHLDTAWFGNTKLESFISTGHAAQNLANPGSKFQQKFAEATLGVVPADIQARRVALSSATSSIDETRAQKILDAGGLAKQPGLTAVQSLSAAILSAQTASQVTALENAVKNVP